MYIVFDFLKIKWDESNGVSLKTHKEYFSSFGKEFFKKIIEQTNDFKRNTVENYENEGNFNDDLVKEILYQAYLCEKYALRFMEREDLLNKVYF